MKQMFLRGLLTGLVAGIGADLFWIFLDVKGVARDNLAGWVAAGLAGGALLGLVMMMLLAFLRWLDRRRGTRWAQRLEASEPGFLGFLIALVCTFPGAAAGCLGFGYAGWMLLVGLYNTLPDQYSFVVPFFLGLFLLPTAVLTGLSLGALAGATLGASCVGLVRGMLSKRSTGGDESQGT